MSLAARLDDLNAKTAAKEGARATTKRYLDDLTRECQELAATTELLNKTELALGDIAQKTLAQSTKAIDQLVTNGLRSVFTDQNLEFQTATETYRGKTSLSFTLKEDGQEAPIEDSYGGGVLCVTGTLLRVVTIAMLGLRRVLILDETMAHVSDKYTANVSALFKKLAKATGFTIVMVTHSTEFAASADRLYLATETGNATTFKDVTPGAAKHADNPNQPGRSDSNGV